MTPDLWAAMPLAAVAATAFLVLFSGVLRLGRHTTIVGVIGLLFAAAWCIATPPASAAPWLGISFTPFARFFTILFSLTGVATLLLSSGYNRRRGIGGEEFPATVLFAAFGMITVSVATTLLVLFLGLEALTFAFYMLVAMDRDSAASAEAGLKYLLMGVVAAAFIAFGIALLYAATGTLAIGESMALALGTDGNRLAMAGWGLLLMGLAFKISLVPAHLWTPDVYEGAPAPAVAFLSTGSKGASVAALLLLLSAQGAGYLREPLWVLSLLSMVVGNLAALAQQNVKRMLAYSSVAQMGYIVLALLTGTAQGYEAVIFYVVTYTAMNLAAFGAIAAIGTDGERESLQGSGYARPLSAGVLALSMLALAGIPPTGGFMGKFFIFAAAIRGGETGLAVIGIVTAAVSVYYYLRVVATLFMHPVRHGASSDDAAGPGEAVALAGTAAVILGLGLYPAPLLRLISIVLGT